MKEYKQRNGFGIFVTLCILGCAALVLYVWASQPSKTVVKLTIPKIQFEKGK